MFRLYNEKACKHLWKCAIEHHAFFRLRAPVKGPSARQNFFRMGSRFRYSGKTEFQTTQQSRARRTVQFERRPSQRFARRQSHVLRERQRVVPPSSSEPDQNSDDTTPTSQSVTPSPSIQTVIQNHVSSPTIPSTSENNATNIINGNSNSLSRCSNKSLSSEEGYTKIGSFGKAGVNLKYV